VSTPPPPGHRAPGLELADVAYDSDVAQQLVEEVQAEYVERYGGPDATPLVPEEFAPPSGSFLVAFAGGEPVGSVGLRRHDDGAVEIKRLYVRAAHRRRGHARALLAAVEERARALGYRRVVLETGSRQPEAVALYLASGYERAEPFGHYADSGTSIHLAKDL
jgi:ribosomal protein S18 acetylase RimI-like enzyme